MSELTIVSHSDSEANASEIQYSIIAHAINCNKSTVINIKAKVINWHYRQSFYRQDKLVYT